MILYQNLSIVLIVFSLMSVCIANRFDSVEEEEEEDDISTQQEQLQSEQQSSVGAVGSIGGLGSAGGIGATGAIAAKQQSSELLQKQQQQQAISKTGISATSGGLGGLSGLLGGYGRGSGQATSSGVGNLVGGLGAAGSGASLGSSAVAASSGSLASKEVLKTSHKGTFDSFSSGFGGISTGIQGLTPSKFTEWSKLIFKPFELVKAIATHFALDIDKFILTIGDSLVFGAEAVLTPYIASVRIIEKIFVPDPCMLRFFCGIGKQLSFMKEATDRLSPFIDSSVSFKSLREGIVGIDCGVSYETCEPKLKNNFFLARSMQAPAEKSAIVVTSNEKKQA